MQTDYYSNIAAWKQWWQGYYKPFHCFHEVQGVQVLERKLYSMKMAKKVCEDWASILLNEKTNIIVDDSTSSLFLCGKDGSGGQFGQLQFWREGNALVEKSFYSGTGAFVLKLDGMGICGNEVVPDGSACIRLDYLTGLQIIPLTVHSGNITEAAFVSDVMVRGKPFVYLELHELDESGFYVITNLYFSEKYDVLTPEPIPKGVAPVFRTGSPIPLFAIVTPNIVNNIDGGGGLGQAVFAGAIDNLMGVDLAYNNFCRDFYLGGKKVFYNKSLLKAMPDARGNILRVAPDDVMQQLFMQMGEDDVDAEQLVHEFNPDLRVTDNKDGVQAQLDYLSFKCGLGTKHYQFNAGSIVTATQYAGDKQELIQNASKHSIIIEDALRKITRAILWAGKEVLGQPVNPDADIAVTFDDGYVIDKESERLRDLAEIRDGILQKWEYRVKWYGEDETTAKRLAGDAQTDNALIGFGGE